MGFGGWFWVGKKVLRIFLMSSEDFRRVFGYLLFIGFIVG